MPTYVYNDVDHLRAQSPAFTGTTADSKSLDAVSSLLMEEAAE